MQEEQKERSTSAWTGTMSSAQFFHLPRQNTAFLLMFCSRFFSECHVRFAEENCRDLLDGEYCRRIADPAGDNECFVHPEFMRENCRITCNFCRPFPPTTPTTTQTTTTSTTTTTTTTTTTPRTTTTTTRSTTTEGMTPTTTTTPRPQPPGEAITRRPTSVQRSHRRIACSLGSLSFFL